MPLQGSLGHLGLADLLQTGLTGQAEGTLTLRNGAARAALYVAEDGLYLLEPSALDPDEVVRAFMMRGMVSQAAVEKARRRAPEGMALLDTLVESGAIDEGELMETLAGAAEDTILDLLTWNRGDFRFEEGPLDQSRVGLVGRTGVDPGGVMLRAAQRMDERGDIAVNVGYSAVLFIANPGLPPDPEDGTDPTPEVYDSLDGKMVIDEVALILGIGRFSTLKSAFRLVQEGRARVAGANELAQAAEDRIAQRQYRIARLLILQWVEAEPTDPEPLRRLVRLAIARGSVEEEIDGHRSIAHLFLGMGQPEEAVASLRVGLERHPHSPPLLTALRDAAEAAGDVQSYAEGTMRMAEASLNTGDAEQAAALLEPLARAQPRSLHVHMMRAKALLKTGDRENVVTEAEAVARIIGRKSKRPEERDASVFFRDALATVAPDRGDLLKRFTNMAETGKKQGGHRVAIGLALLAVFAGAGVLLWPKGAASLLRDAESAWAAGRRSEATQVISELIERYPDSEEAEAAFLLQARILSPAGTSPETVSVNRELKARVAELTAKARQALSDLPAEQARGTIDSLLAALEESGALALRRTTLSTLNTELYRAIQLLSHEARERADILSQSADAHVRLRGKPEALRAYLERAYEIRDAAYTSDLRATVEVVRRIGRLHDDEHLLAAVRNFDRAVEGLEWSVAGNNENLSNCRRTVMMVDLARVERRIRESAPALLVNGKFDDADALYVEMEGMIEELRGDLDLSALLSGLERRRVPEWLRQKREQIADIQRDLRGAEAAQEAGDLDAAAQAYVALIKKYEYIRFETVFALPLEVDSVPPGASVLVNGRPAGSTPVVVRYGWGSNTAVTVSAPGYAPSTHLIATAEQNPSTQETIHLAPESLWQVPVEATVAAPPVAVGQRGDVLTVDRSGRITLYDGNQGTIRWARHYKSLEGVRARPVVASGVIHVAFVNGRMLFVDPRDGQRRGELLLPRPHGDPAVQEDVVAVATMRGELIVLRNREIAHRETLDAAASAGVLGAHGAFWVGTSDGAVVRMAARGGAVRKIAMPGSASPVTGLAATSDGIVAATASGRLVALTAAGDERWTKDGVGDVIGAPAAVSGIVAVSDRRGRVLFFDEQDGAGRGAVEMGSEPHGGLVAVRDVALATLADGRLWAMNPATRRVRIDSPLGSAGHFAPGVLGEDLVGVSTKGDSLSLMRVPADLGSE